MVRYLPLLSLPLAGAALIVALSGPSKEEEAAPEPEIEYASQDDLDALWSRIKTLEADADLLRSRLRALEGRQQDGAQAAGAPVAGGAALPIVAPGVPPAKAREELKEMVRSVQDELREQEQRERMERREQREREMQQERERRIREFVTSHRLDYRQEQVLLSGLQQEQERRAQLFEEARDGRRTMAEVRQELRNLRKAHDAELRSVLSEEQYRAYRSEQRTFNRPASRRDAGRMRMRDGRR